MTSLELLDSKRFCAEMDTLVAEWPKATDQAKAKMLDSLAHWAEGIPAPISIPAGTVHIQVEEPKRKSGRPKGSKNKNAEPNPEAPDRAALRAEMTRKLTPAEVTETLASIKNEPKARDPQLIVDDAVAQVIKPNWAKTPQQEGYRHFIVNADRNGERVSFELEKWRTALGKAGLSCGDIAFKPEGLGMSPGSLETGRSGNQWRVMIA
jgi:hypothetical protein